MPLIAITREMGSLGKDVAEGLSQTLGIPVIYHEIIEHLADRMRVRKSHVERLLDGSAGLLQRLTADKTSLSIFSADEIVNFAMQSGGAVVRGWGATHLLRKVPHAVCLRVCAPLEVRRQRMMERLGTDELDKVSEEIHNNDEAHGAIMRRHFALDWTDPAHYDVVFNTERVNVAECVDKATALVRSAAFAETQESRRRLEDLALACRVRAALRSSALTRDLRLVVDVEGGRVTLDGVVDRDEQRTAVGDVAAAVAGVRVLEDKLRARDQMRSRYN